MMLIKQSRGNCLGHNDIKTMKLWSSHQGAHRETVYILLAFPTTAYLITVRIMQQQVKSFVKQKKKPHAPYVSYSTDWWLGQSLKVETHICILTAEETTTCPKP